MLARKAAAAVLDGNTLGAVVSGCCCDADSIDVIATGGVVLVVVVAADIAEEIGGCWGGDACLTIVLDWPTLLEAWAMAAADSFLRGGLGFPIESGRRNWIEDEEEVAEGIVVVVVVADTDGVGGCCCCCTIGAREVDGTATE